MMGGPVFYYFKRILFESIKMLYTNEDVEKTKLN